MENKKVSSTLYNLRPSGEGISYMEIKHIDFQLLYALTLLLHLIFRNVLKEYLFDREKEVVTIMMSLFDEEQIIKSFIKSERHDEARETAEYAVFCGTLCHMTCHIDFLCPLCIFLHFITSIFKNLWQKICYIFLLLHLNYTKKCLFRPESLRSAAGHSQGHGQAG